jgi:murein DD-endopeptidase MepM/ murein hydrolase activator NlpD
MPISTDLSQRGPQTSRSIASAVRAAPRPGFVAAFTTPLVLTLAMFGSVGLSELGRSQLDQLAQQLLVTDTSPYPPPKSTEIVVEKGDTLEKIFKSVGLSSSLLEQLRADPGVATALDKLHPGDLIRLRYLGDTLYELNRNISDTLSLAIKRIGDEYQLTYVESPFETTVGLKRAQVHSSLFEAGRDAGLSDTVIMTMAEQMFGWDIDFALDVQRGDEFSVLYENRVFSNNASKAGKVLAAEFVNNGKSNQAVWFESQDGSIRGYFTPDGKSVKKAFMRAPLDYLRVSSGFNPRRVHPVSGRVRAHKGIDYAAPVGTPIRAAGDGTVQFVGAKGGYGKTVVLQHNKGVTTLYGHMSRFGAGLRSGRQVKQGDVIGYVGMTGVTTGPHLHYEYRVNNVHRNPAQVSMPRQEIPRYYMSEFQTVAEPRLAQLTEADLLPVANVAKL